MNFHLIKLINAVIKDWGCDAVFFFNYNRINIGITNPALEKNINALFGKARAESLRENLTNKSPIKRESIIIKNLCQALEAYGSRYVLPFRFKNAKGNRTSHHLIFVSKDFRGYEIMKDIMARESTSDIEGVPAFEHNPADLISLQMPLPLFQPDSPLDDLKIDLLTKFSNQTIKMIKLYEQHCVNTPYIKKNYKEVLRKLFDDGKIQAVSLKGKPPRKGTFGDNILVTFE